MHCTHMASRKEELALAVTKDKRPCGDYTLSVPLPSMVGWFDGWKYARRTRNHESKIPSLPCRRGWETLLKPKNQPRAIVGPHGHMHNLRAPLREL